MTLLSNVRMITVFLLRNSPPAHGHDTTPGLYANQVSIEQSERQTEIIDNVEHTTEQRDEPIISETELIVANIERETVVHIERETDLYFDNLEAGTETMESTANYTETSTVFDSLRPFQIVVNSTKRVSLRSSSNLAKLYTLHLDGIMAQVDYR